MIKRCERTIVLSCILALLWLATFHCYGQDLPVQHRFYRLNEEQGLSNGFVNKIVQDTLGFLWVGTNDGLFRFDGKHFQSFRTSSAIPVPDNTINDLLVDKNNKIWAMTNYGLAIYSYESDSIIQKQPDELFGDKVGRVVTCAAQVSNGTIYMGSDEAGLHKYENERFSEVPIDIEGQPYALEDIADLALDHSVLWIGTWTNGIIRYNIRTGQAEALQFSTSDHDLTVYIKDLFVDSFGRLWIGTNLGVYTISENGSRIYLQPIDNPVLQNVDVLTIHEDADGTIWIGTRSQGLYRLEQSVLTHFKPSVDRSSVSHRTISAIFQDESENLWLGTHNNGIDVFHPDGEIVRNISTVQPEGTGTYMSESIWGIHNAQNGIWMGTDGSGLYHYSPATDEIVPIASSDISPKLTDDAILTVLEASDQTLWLGTYKGGINVLSPDRQSVRSYSVANSPLSVNDVRVLYEDDSQTIWIGTNRGGLYQFSESAQEITKISNTGFYDIRGILKDDVDSNLLWLATYGYGLVKFYIKEQLVMPIEWDTTQSHGPPIGLSIDQTNEHIWLGTMQSGLIRIDKKTDETKVFDESVGIINNTVRSVLALDKNIWIGTNAGLSVLEMDSENIRNFNTSDGLQNGQFNDGSLIQTANGYLAVGGIHGMDIFDPDELMMGQRLPQITFTKLKINNEVVRPGTSNSIDASLPITSRVTLFPDQDVFTIEFNVIEFPSALGWRYEFLLEGFDSHWTTGTGNNNATYRNVPPGNYTFQVRAVDPAMSRSGNVNSLSIKVLPPWWNTIYSRIGLAILVSVIIWIIYRNIKDRVTMKQRLYYEQKIRQQEHDAMQDKIRFYTNFSHEMKTPITLISGPVNDLLRNEEIPQTQKKSLRLIKRNAHTLLKLINRLLEFRKLETENTMLNVSYHDLTILAQEEAESFSYLAKDQDIKFGFYCETDLKAWIDIEKLQIIINNLLSNALRYSEPNSKVTFRVAHEAPNIIISVADEGRGIDQEELEQIFTPFYQAKNSIGTGGTGIGLALCKSFVDLHGGNISVTSELGAGTTFNVTLPEGKGHLESLDYVRFIDVTQGEIDESISHEEVEQVSPLDNEQVLLIADDNRDIRIYVASLFEHKFNVIQASDGQKALDLARTTVPDIIISDIMMPGLDGLEFCRAIKEHVATSHVPVVLLTAKGTSQTKIEGYDVGADGYLTKPFDSEVLVARVNNLLQSREHLRELHDRGQWIENKDVPSREIEFILKVEATVLDLIPGKELSVTKLCRELGFSRTSLYRKIKSLTGQSIKQFIRSIKLKKAAEMLATEDMAVSEIAFALDFTDLKYFRTCFKKHHGKLPLEYQNEMKSNEPVNQEEIRKALKIS